MRALLPAEKGSVLTRRQILHLLVLAMVGGAAMAATPTQAQDSCHWAVTTAYTSAAFPGRMANGERTVGQEWSVMAAAWRYPMGSRWLLHDLGEFRVADRGLLDEHGISFDVLVYSLAEAQRVTGSYVACRVGAQ